MPALETENQPARASAGADVLVVEDRDSLRTMLRRTLAAQGYRVLDARTVSEARRLLGSSRISVVLTDLRLPGGGSGRDVLAAAREADPNVPVIVMTAYGSVEDAVSAMKEGAFDFLAKPVDTDHLLVITERAVNQRRLLMENLILKEEYAARFGFPEIVGEHPALQSASIALQRAAGSDTTVLLLGESGTGKELFARALHHLGNRRDGPFIAINCAAIPGELLENELFGHEKGAYTGATSRKLGKLELASGGTVLLDEIGELPLALQSKLLRVLQERSFERVGGTATLNVDVRLVAATNRDLRRAVAAVEFREDLYFRISVFPVTIPALRERASDIPMLARYYVDRLCKEMNKARIAIPPECIDLLVAYEWPGNVRELANCLERAVILCDGDELRPEQLGLGVAAARHDTAGLDLEGSLSDVSRRAARRAERAKILQVLNAVGFDRAQAAEHLDISGKTLLHKLREYGLEGALSASTGTT
ncbi:MAG TPA: sigma-54 dependent transcriptional regulator [Vicinamibacteria bacterium]|nr:sigma-54 dependent transcriptional regulator [Vicinamibacteria bacterium]